MRKQRPFADGWRKVNVPTLDDAGDDDQIVLYPSAKLLRHGTLKTIQRLSARHAYNRGRDDQRRPADQRPREAGAPGSRSDAVRCEHLSIHPRARRIWREGVAKK